ncbi:conserved hypothetical protein [Dinoroseobacter shibae DFL 12 = DSM 16493]|jgi:hypothetical protein|uniref:Phasin domain-containing protein n=1 Tax=Dinoroseobacter shibae (strain DSM 16493 / NCIMB 14021 / DFL 12) TaxID=398580 RepID=A8LN34_DINSH|nr:hypothetical protein [Dinoroseobacter shibae]ABV92178.1 conserved hypothetical protein [Dinoroseobacter shibae DFL 12 = DSM 16493]URF47133.1 hypothetical protein M8008_02205 [Dinoroseobacter shibae]URF51444.1 hypothetical protein M8007_02205 [Dinoroseobacter shibae]
MARTAKPPANDATETALNAAQVVFSLNPAFRPQSEHLAQAQQELMKEAEKFSSAWFKRRHEALHSALEVTSHIASTGMMNPAGAMQAMAEWQTRSAARLAEDARDCTEFMSQCARTMIEHEIEATEEAAENTKHAMSKTRATPV